jgi:hypothetical protein
MTADDLETDVCCFFVIVAGRADGGNDFSNTLLRVQAEEPADRIIFVKTTPQRRRN